MRFEYEHTAIIGRWIFILGLICCLNIAQAQRHDTRMKTSSEKKLLENPRLISDWLRRNRLEVGQVPNPHWRRDGCLACHEKLPNKKSLYLRSTDVDRECNNCHSSVSQHDYIHPSNIIPDRAMKARMPTSFRNTIKRNRGKVTCITCHDLPMQCKSERFSERSFNPFFLRKGPYRTRSAICYRCHDESAYQRLNPHDQIDDHGKVRKNRCLVCHQHLAKLDKAKNIKDVDFNVSGRLANMCTGCHPWIPHPGGPTLFARDKKIGLNHLVVPSRQVAQHRKETLSGKHDVILPLDPRTGQVFCGTCHNPHEKGIIKNVAANAGADSKNRLRMKGICHSCHDK